MNSDRLKLRKAIRGAITKVRDERMEGTLGRLNSDGSITVEGSRQNYVIVRMPNGTYTELPNIGIGKVPLRPGLPVKIKRLHTGELVLDGENERLLGDDSNMPGAVYTVNDIGPDGTGNVTLDSDDIGEGATNQYYTAERARDDIGAALVAGTGITITPSDPGDTITIATTITQYTDEAAQDAVGAMVTGNTETDIAVTYDDAGNKLNFVVSATLVGDRIHAATGKTTPVDADELGLADSAASFVLKKLTWANLKATIKSYFDTLYGQLAAANTWTQMNQFNPANTTGVGLGITRDLAAAGTDSPVVSIIQDNAGDDQTAFRLQQDGTGSILAAFDGATLVFAVRDGGDVQAGSLIGSVAANGDITIQGTTDSTRASSYVALQPNGGLVVIGAASSTNDTTLDVVPVGVNVPLRLRAGAGGSAYIQFTPADASAEWGFLSALVGSLSITHNTGPVVFQAAATEALRLLSGGKASVGGLASINATILGIKAGAGTNDAAVGGTLYLDSATHGNTTTGVTDLATYTVPADTLSANNMLLEFHAWGTTAANGNNKKVDVLFGSDSFTIFNTATSNAGSWSVRGKIVRTGAATQVVIIETQVSLIVATAVIASTATRTLSGSNVLKLQGTATLTNDIVQRGFDVRWADANV